MNEEVTLELGTMYQSEIINLKKEFKRIKEKHETENNSCFYEILEMYPVEEGLRIVLKANSNMLAAFVKEQMT